MGYMFATLKLSHPILHNPARFAKPVGDLYWLTLNDMPAALNVNNPGGEFKDTKFSERAETCNRFS